MNKMVSIVILNYRNWRDTVECLHTVLDVTYKPVRVIVVDNDSQNDSLAHIAGWLKERNSDSLLFDQNHSETREFSHHPLVLIQSSSNRGYAAGNNIGIRWALRSDDEYVMTLNNDTLVDKGFLEPLVDFLESHPETAMVGPKIVNLEGNIDPNCARRRPTIPGYLARFGVFRAVFPNNPWIRRHYYRGEYDFKSPRMVDVLAGSCILVRSAVLRQMNLLDEGTFLFLEEFILCEKIRALNKQTFIVPESVIRHKCGASIKGVPSLFVLRKGLESLRRYLTVYRHVPGWLCSLIMYDQYLKYFFWKLRLSLSGRARGGK